MWRSLALTHTTGTVRSSFNNLNTMKHYNYWCQFQKSHSVETEDLFALNVRDAIISKNM
jgi:hypothetical protein